MIIHKLLFKNSFIVKGSSGDIGGDSSHEFHIISDVGEDEVLFCPQ